MYVIMLYRHTQDDTIMTVFWTQHKRWRCAQPRWKLSTESEFEMRQKEGGRMARSSDRRAIGVLSSLQRGVGERKAHGKWRAWNGTELNWLSVLPISCTVLVKLHILWIRALVRVHEICNILYTLGCSKNIVLIAHLLIVVRCTWLNNAVGQEHANGICAGRKYFSPYPCQIISHAAHVTKLLDPRPQLYKQRTPESTLLAMTTAVEQTSKCFFIAKVRNSSSN